MMYAIFALPENFVGDINANATDVIGSLSGPLTLIIGVLLALLAVGYIISAISK